MGTWTRFIGVAGVGALVATGLIAAAPPAAAAGNPAFSVFDIPNSPYGPGSPVVALTFDDGPTTQITPGVLDTLARHGATATFFVVGGLVTQHPDLVRRAVALGNSVQVHTMDHLDITKLSAAQIAAQVDPEIALLRDLTSHQPTCLRPPYGAWNAAAVATVATHGLESVMWNVNPGDTEAGSTTASITSRALAGARPGAIIAMHDSATKASTLAALPAILDGLRSRGLSTVPLCTQAPVPIRDVAVRADGRSGYALDASGMLHPFGGAPKVDAAVVPGQLGRRVVLRADGVSGYTLDGFGGVHPFGGAPAAAGTAYWNGWDIARGLALRPDGQSGWVLDGFGGLHPFGGAPVVPQVTYWSGWDIGRAIAATPDGNGGYVLDGCGGMHPFGSATAIPNAAYWPGRDIARGIALGFDGRSGWIVDNAGALAAFGAAPPARSNTHWSGDVARGVGVGADGVTGVVVDVNGTVAPFVGGPTTRALTVRTDASSGYTLDASGRVSAFGGAPAAVGAPSWPAWDIARDVVVRADGASGYVLDGLGGIHSFSGAPAVAGASLPFDLARRIVVRADGASGYVLDGWGGLHSFGGAPAISGATAYWPGWDIARAVALRADGVSGWVLDGFGGVHPFGGAPALPAQSFHAGHPVVTDLVGVAGTDHAATVDLYGTVTGL